MTIVHRLTGYDRRTEALEYEFDVPDDRVSEVRRLARMPDNDESNRGSFPLEPDAASQIAGRLHLPISVDRFDWFLEPFAAD